MTSHKNISLIILGLILINSCTPPKYSFTNSMLNNNPPKSIAVIGLIPYAIPFNSPISDLEKEAYQEDNWWTESINDSLYAAISRAHNNNKFLSITRVNEMLTELERTDLLNTLRMDINVNTNTTPQLFKGIDIMSDSLNKTLISELCNILDVDALLVGIARPYVFSMGSAFSGLLVQYIDFKVVLYSQLILVDNNGNTLWWYKCYASTISGYTAKVQITDKINTPLLAKANIPTLLFELPSHFSQYFLYSGENITMPSPIPLIFPDKKHLKVWFPESVRVYIQDANGNDIFVQNKPLEKTVQFGSFPQYRIKWNYKYNGQQIPVGHYKLIVRDPNTWEDKVYMLYCLQPGHMDSILE